jgi:hypothetical protein
MDDPKIDLSVHAVSGAVKTDASHVSGDCGRTSTGLMVI